MPQTLSPYTSFIEELKEFEEEEAKINKEFEFIHAMRVDLYENEVKLKKRIEQQLKALSSLQQQLKDHSNLADITLDRDKQQAKLDNAKEALKRLHNEILNPGSRFLRLFLGSVNSVVLNGHASRRYKFKQEYEEFKRKCTLWNIPITFLLLFLFNNRVLDTFYQIWLFYFYLTLAMRESILQVNGSRINTWWIVHHYLSILLVMTLLTWPSTVIYRQFRPQFFVYAFYTAIVQLLQYQYQTQRLYVMKTLGKANQMDVANSDSTQVVLSRQFMFLLPFIFFGQLFQFFNALCLFYWCVSSGEWQEWQAYLVGLEFFVLAYGNFITTVRIFRRKWKKWQDQKKQKND